MRLNDILLLNGLYGDIRVLTGIIYLKAIDDRLWVSYYINSCTWIGIDTKFKESRRVKLNFHYYLHDRAILVFTEKLKRFANDL